MNIALCTTKNNVEASKLLLKYGDVKEYFNAVDLLYELAEKEKYDLVVVDLNGAKGMNLCSRIRSQHNSIPIIWVSDDDEFKLQAKRLLVDGFLIKPIMESEINKIIKYIFNN